MQRGRDAPAEDADGGPDVRRDELPHQSQGLEEDIGYVKDREEPLVLGGGELEVLGQAGDFGVARTGCQRGWLGGIRDRKCKPDIGPVKVREKILGLLLE